MMTDKKTPELDFQRRNERLRVFMENTAEAIWCVDFEQPIPIDLPEDEQIDLMYKHGYVSEANDAWALSAGFERSEDLVGERIKDIAPSSIAENIASLKKLVRAGSGI
jgi:PAS domain-containing protein